MSFWIRACKLTLYDDSQRGGWGRPIFNVESHYFLQIKLSRELLWREILVYAVKECKVQDHVPHSKTSYC